MLLIKERSATDRHLPELDLKLPEIRSPFPRRSGPGRWPVVVVGFVVAGIATWAIVTNASLRQRITDSVTGVRHRFDVLWTETRSKPIQPVAFDAAETAPITTDTPTPDSRPTPDPLYAGTTDYPEGLGSNETTRATDETVKIR